MALYNQAVDDEPTTERCESFGGGMDAFSPPTLLAPDAFQYGENIVLPDNLRARTRPGADRFCAAFAAKMQGALYFDTPSQEKLIVESNDAFSLVDSSAVITALTGWTPASGADFIAAQGVDKALFTDGTTLRRYSAGTAFDGPFSVGNDGSPPAGASFVVWHAGRMWAMGFSGSVDDEAYRNDAIWASALGAYGDGDWSKTDRTFRIGQGEGDQVIAAASLCSSAKDGFILAVGKENSIWLVNTDPRLQITNFQAAMGPEQQTDGIGFCGKRAFTVRKGDLYFASPDKNFYSLARMDAAASQHVVGPALSLPMNPYVARINWDHDDTIAVTSYGNYILFSVPLDSATAPNTVMVFNANLQKWMGIWTGWTANCWETTRFNGVHRLIHGDSVGNVRVWKDYADDGLDATYKDDGTDIPTKLWSRAMLFGDANVNKSAQRAQARFGESNALVTITAVADNADLKSWQGDLRQGAPNLPIDLPFDLTSETNTPITKRLIGLRRFNELFLKIESSSGWWQLNNLSLAAFLRCLRGDE
jgi:hypothetical protein